MKYSRKKKTGKRVKVYNGRTTFERAVWNNSITGDFFIYEGKEYQIWQDEKGIHRACWFNKVEYIA